MIKEDNLKSSTLQFLKNLKDNNDRTWFEKNRSRYEEARADFMTLFEQLVNEVAQFDNGVAEDRESAKKVFRIYRDVRFSKDKSPYKKHLGGAIVPGGMNSGYAGYYVHIQPGGQSGTAGGMYDLDSKILLKVRKAISERFEEFSRIIEDKEFVKEFGAVNKENVLKRVPSGFDPADPAAEYLKLKSFIVRKSFSDEEILHNSFVQKTASAFRTLKMLNDFLNKAL